MGWTPCARWLGQMSSPLGRGLFSLGHFWSDRNHWIAPGVLVVVAALAWYAYEVVPGLLLGKIDCANDVQAISRSPNDVYESRLFLRNCSATTGSVSIVTIRHAETPGPRSRPTWVT